MKKFDCSIACYKVKEKNLQSGISTIIATHSQQLLIYCDARLMWAANLFNVPICIEVCEIKNTPGTLVLLEENSRVSCSYLGTTPSLFTLPQSYNRSKDIEQIESEINDLRTQFKKLQASTASEKSLSPSHISNESPLDVSIEVSK